MVFSKMCKIYSLHKLGLYYVRAEHSRLEIVALACCSDAIGGEVGALRVSRCVAVLRCSFRSLYSLRCNGFYVAILYGGLVPPYLEPAGIL